MSTPRRDLAPATALLAAVALGGCGGGDISGAKVEQLARDTLAPAPQSVACPDGIRPKSGRTFTCRLAYADGDVGRLRIHVIDEAGHVVAGSSDLTIDTIGARHAENAIAALTKKNKVGLRSVRCPGDTPVAAGTIKCDVVDVKGVRVAATLHIGPDATVTLNPARDLRVKSIPGRRRPRASR